MSEQIEVSRQCEKCWNSQAVSLDEDRFVCTRCNHENFYDNVEIKLEMDALLQRLRRAKDLQHRRKS